MDFMFWLFLWKLFEPSYRMENGNKSNLYLWECSFLLTYSSVRYSNLLLLTNNSLLKFFHQQLGIKNLNFRLYFTWVRFVKIISIIHKRTSLFVESHFSFWSNQHRNCPRPTSASGRSFLINCQIWSHYNPISTIPTWGCDPI